MLPAVGLAWYNDYLNNVFLWRRLNFAIWTILTKIVRHLAKEITF